MFQCLYNVPWKCWEQVNKPLWRGYGLTLTLKCFITLAELRPWIHVPINMFLLPALWVTDLLLGASAHWVQKKKLGWRRGEKVNKMWGATASIMPAFPAAYSDSLRRSEYLNLPQTIHHSHTSVTTLLWLSYVFTVGFTHHVEPTLYKESWH